MTDADSRGEELGSVGDIDREFGSAELILDISQLFTPLGKVVESPSTLSAL